MIGALLVLLSILASVVARRTGAPLLLACGVVLFPITFLLGGTLPALLRAVAGESSDERLLRDVAVLLADPIEGSVSARAASDDDVGRSVRALGYAD